MSCKPLPSPYVEWNSRPTPVLNLQPYCCVSFRDGAGIHSRLLPIARYAFPVDHAGTILPTNGESCCILDTHWPNGSKYLHLLFAHRIRIKRYWGLHRSQGQQLKQMVRHHIAQGAGFFVERRAVLDSNRFSRGDLHIVDVVSVPHRFEQRVAEAEDEDVLHCLFAEIVVNTVDRFLVEYSMHDVIQGVCRSPVAPQ